MIRTRTKKTLTKAEQARQVKMLTAMGERLTRDNVDHVHRRGDAEGAGAQPAHAQGEAARHRSGHCRE